MDDGQRRTMTGRTLVRNAAAATLVVALIAGGCSADKKPASRPSKTTTTAATKPVLSKDVPFGDILKADGQFTAFLELATAGDLDALLATGGPYTLFVPSNDAIAALGDATVNSLKAGPSDALTAFLKRHIVKGTLLYPDLFAAAGTSLTSLGGDAIAVTVEGQTVSIGGAPIAKSDIQTDDGVIQVLGAAIKG